MFELSNLLPNPSAPVVRTHRVLVVDDDAAFGRSVAETLEDRDLEVRTVCDPQEALALARGEAFAAAVVDLVMPEMDGLELARELRRANPDIEVVMLTGHADMGSAIAALRSEVFDYLQKHALQATRLRRAVRGAISRSHLLAENRRLLAGLREGARRLTMLNDLSARLASEHHLDRLTAGLLTVARDISEAAAARVLLMEGNEFADLQLLQAWGDGRATIGGWFGPGDGIAAEVARKGVPVRVAVPSDHPAYSERCDELGSRLQGLVCVPLLSTGVTGSLTVAGRARPFTEEDAALLASLARQGAIAIANARAHEVNANFFTHASEMLVSLLDAHDVHYRGHARSVASLADMVARRMGLPEQQRRAIHFAALLHDVGKLRLPPGLLAASRRLSADELALVRQHPALGVELVRPIARWGDLAATIISHHERWDGKGYPRGLAGADIPLGGRIVAVAEAFEAMIRSTPFGSSRSRDEALAEVQACAGTQFDPTVARLFVTEYRLNRERFESAVA